MKFKDAKEKMIQNIIIRSTLNGALQRSRLYKMNIEDRVKKKFRNALSKELKSVHRSILDIKNYDTEKHYKTIEKFVEKINVTHSNILKNNILRIGTAQKLINLYWKMSWILQNTKKPIHCPFDGIIISDLKIKGKPIRWTKIKSIDQYKILVEAAEIIAGKGKSIAEWELKTYIGKVGYDD